MSESGLHKALVQSICYTHEAEQRGFGQKLKTTFGDYLADGLIPDAYRMEADVTTLTVFEVEVTNPLSARHIEAYVRLWFYLDCEGWTTNLVVVDRFGQETQISDEQLGEMYYRLLLSSAYANAL